MLVKQSSPHLHLVGAPASAPAPAPSHPDPARDDSELLACVRSGDDSAATELYDRLRPRIEGVVRRLLGSSDVDVEDLVQNALVEVVTSIERYSGESSLESWACAIAAHVVYRHIRRRRLERRIFSSEQLPEAAEPTTSSTCRVAIARGALTRVRGHLGEMDEAKAWAFLLHDVCGFDLREIADITEVSVAAAQSRLVRGRREIHERIANDPELAELLDQKEDPS